MATRCSERRWERPRERAFNLEGFLRTVTFTASKTMICGCAWPAPERASITYMKCWGRTGCTTKALAVVAISLPVNCRSSRVISSRWTPSCRRSVVVSRDVGEGTMRRWATERSTGGTLRRRGEAYQTALMYRPPARVVLKYAVAGPIWFALQEFYRVVSSVRPDRIAPQR